MVKNLCANAGNMGLIPELSLMLCMQDVCHMTQNWWSLDFNAGLID